jgi:hypothetical protein
VLLLNFFLEHVVCFSLAKVARVLLTHQMPLSMKGPKGLPLGKLQVSNANQLWPLHKLDNVLNLGHNQNTSLHGHIVVTKGMVQIKIASNIIVYLF